ncbi:MAG: DNA-protecting protein DprA [Firmicutes bacterium]|nr:DNA-protecting protein DprA [Bacillota bacterium]
MGMGNRYYLIAFNMVQGIGPRRLAALTKHFGSLDKAWRAAAQELMRVPGIGRATAMSIAARRGAIDPIKEERWAQRHGGRIVTIADDGYPPDLRSHPWAPPVLYVVGHLPEKLGIAVVGTRKPSPTGIAQARVFASEFARRGFAVVSGLARGIDEAAHAAALRAGGLTVAVLGSHIGRVYPVENARLAERISESGAVVSEFASTHPTLPGNFPRRNRIIAGLSQRILVVQAGSKSGALNTADWGADLGKDVWAIPGEISDPLRQGTNCLIQQGAGLAADPGDVLLGLADVLDGSRAAGGDALRRLYRMGASPDQISAQLNLPITTVLARITELELAGEAEGHPLA